MKTNSTLKLWTLALVLTLSVAACKKKDNPEPAPPPVEVKTMTITELKALSTGASVKVPDNHKVKGIVISDAAAKNIDSKTVIFQEATDKPALIVTFDATQTFAVGDEVELTISNQTLSQVNGEVILQNLPSANVKKTGTGAIEAKQTTIAEIKTNKAAWNGMLVSLNATDLTSADGKYNGSLTVKDATGELTSTVLAGASFATNNLPISVSKLVGIVRISGNDTRVDIRNSTDVVSGAVTSVESILIPDQIRFVGGNAYSTRGTTPIAADANFTDPTKFYAYLLRVNTSAAFTKVDQSGILTFADAIKPGAKTIKITFAGSALKGAVDGGYFGDYVPNFTLADFAPTSHNIKIGIGLGTSDSPIYSSALLGESPVYNEVGKFYSFTINFPTKAELVSKGLSVDNADYFLASPQIAIYNLSSKRSTIDGADNYGFAPVLVSKVEIGY